MCVKNMYVCGVCAHTFKSGALGEQKRVSDLQGVVSPKLRPTAGAASTLNYSTTSSSPLSTFKQWHFYCLVN